MSVKFVSSEFIATDGPGRASACRELAIEAARLAAKASSREARADYLEIELQWNNLADEIEASQRTAIKPT